MLTMIEFPKEVDNVIFQFAPCGEVSMVQISSSVVRREVGRFRSCGCFYKGLGTSVGHECEFTDVMIVVKHFLHHMASEW